MKNIGDHHGAPGGRVTAAGLAILLVSVSVGINLGAGGIGFLLSFAGVLAGVGLVGVGVRESDCPAPSVPVMLGDGVRGPAPAPPALRRGPLAGVVGLVLASCAITAVSGDNASPGLCIGMFALLLLGVSLINAAGALGE